MVAKAPVAVLFAVGETSQFLRCSSRRSPSPGNQPNRLARSQFRHFNQSLETRMHPVSQTQSEMVLENPGLTWRDLALLDASEFDTVDFLGITGASRVGGSGEGPLKVFAHPKPPVRLASLLIRVRFSDNFVLLYCIDSSKLLGPTAVQPTH